MTQITDKHGNPLRSVSSERKEYVLSVSDLQKLMTATHQAKSKEEAMIRVKKVWRELGDKYGFLWESAHRPADNKNPRVFSAIPKRYMDEADSEERELLMWENPEEFKDTAEFFENMKDLYPVSYEDFKNEGEKTYYGHRYKDYQLEVYPDKPFYHLYRMKKKEEEEDADETTETSEGEESQEVQD